MQYSSYSNIDNFRSTSKWMTLRHQRELLLMYIPQSQLGDSQFCPTCIKVEIWYKSFWGFHRNFFNCRLNFFSFIIRNISHFEECNIGVKPNVDLILICVFPYLSFCIVYWLHVETPYTFLKLRSSYCWYSPMANINHFPFPFLICDLQQCIPSKTSSSMSTYTW